MTTFDERVSAFEGKYAHDDDMQFRVRMRRNRFLAVWASAQHGDTVEAAREFAKKVIHEDLQNVGDEDLIRVAVDYLDGKTDEETVRAKLVEFAREAQEQIKAGI